MKFRCKTCGNIFEEKYHFCPHCGTEMFYPEQEAKAPEATIEEKQVACVPAQEEIKVQEDKRPRLHPAGKLGFIFALISTIGIGSVPGLYLVEAVKLSETLQAIVNFVELLAYLSGLGAGIAGLILSIAGVKKSRSKAMPIVGIIISALSVSSLVAVIFMLLFYGFAMIALLFAFFAAL